MSALIIAALRVKLNVTRYLGIFKCSSVAKEFINERRGINYRIDRYYQTVEAVLKRDVPMIMKFISVNITRENISVFLSISELQICKRTWEIGNINLQG